MSDFKIHTRHSDAAPIANAIIEGGNLRGDVVHIGRVVDELLTRKIIAPGSALHRTVSVGEKPWALEVEGSLALSRDGFIVGPDVPTDKLVAAVQRLRGEGKGALVIGTVEGER